MKSKFLKLFSGFLAITLLFGQMGIVKAYDETVNISHYITGQQQGKLVDSNYVLLTNNLADENAVVYQQYIKITQEEFESINGKLKELKQFNEEHTEYSEEINAQADQLQADANKLVPIFDNAKWTKLTLTEKDTVVTASDGTSIRGNKYNVPLPDNIAYMVSWTKVTVGDTDYYAYFLYCYEEKTTITYKCQIKDGKFYDKDGNEVTQEKYEEDCVINSCSIKDGKYYGKDAEEVDEATYKAQCGNFCKIVDGKYYNDKGNEVTKAEYTKACGNPKTGITNYYMIGGSFIVLAGLGYVLIRNKKLLCK